MMSGGGNSYWDFVRAYDSNQRFDGIQLDLSQYGGDCGGFLAWKGNCDEILQMGPAFDLVKLSPGERQKIYNEIKGVEEGTREEALSFLATQLKNMISTDWFVTGITKYEQKTNQKSESVYCKAGEPSGPCVDVRRNESDPFVERWTTPTGKEKWCAPYFFCYTEKEMQDIRDKYSSLRTSTLIVIEELTRVIEK